MAVYKDMTSLTYDSGITVWNIKDSTARAEIGDLSDLKTPDKTDIVSAINSIALDPEGNVGYAAFCPELTPINDKVTWVITHNLKSSSIVSALYNVTNGVEIVKNVKIDSSNQITVEFNSTSSVSAGSYKIVILSL